MHQRIYALNLVYSRCIKALGICVIEEEGFEGDDILGSLSEIWYTRDGCSKLYWWPR